MLIELSMAISLCLSVRHGYHIEGSYRVVNWRANAGLLLSYPTIYNITSITLKFKITTTNAIII